MAAADNDLPLFVALAKGSDPADHEPMLKVLRRQNVAYQLSGDVWNRVIGADKAADYEAFTRYVSKAGTDGRRRFRGAVLPQAEMGIGTFNIVQNLLQAGRPVLLWENGRFRKVEELAPIPHGTYAKCARAV